MFKRGRELNGTIRFTLIDGQPGALGFDGEGRLVNVMVLDIAGGAIQTVRSIVNPDKLDHLGFPLSDIGRITPKDS